MAHNETSLADQIQQLEQAVKHEPGAVMQRCRELLPTIAESGEDADESDAEALFRLYIAAAEAARALGQLDAGLGLARQALATARSGLPLPQILQALQHVRLLLHRPDQREEKQAVMSEITALDSAELTSDLRFDIWSAAAQTACELENNDELIALLERGASWRDADLTPLRRAEFLWLDATARLAKGDPAAALESNEISVAIYREAGERYHIARQLLFQSILHIMLGRLTQAETAASEAHAVLEQIGNPERVIAAVNLLGICARRRGDLETALRTFESGLPTLRELGNHFETANFLNNIADVHNAAGNYGLALRNAFEALDLLRGIGMGSERQEVSLHQISQAYMKLGDHERALQYTLEMLEMPDVRRYPEMHIQTLLLVGRLYTRIGDSRRAEEYLTEGLQISRSLDNASLRRELLVMLATIKKSADDIDAAETLLRQAQDMPGDDFDALQDAEILRGLGDICLLQAKPDKGRLLFVNALEILEKTGAAEELLATRRALGEVILQQNAAEGLEHLRETLRMAEAQQFETQIPELQHAVAEAFRANGDADAALEHYDNYMAGLHARQDRMSGQRLANLRVLHEVDDARRNAEMLRIENRHLQEDLSERERELTSKALFLSNRNDLLARLNTSLRRLQHAPPHEFRHSLNEVIRTLEAARQEDDDWLQFDERLNAVHQNFLEKMSASYPQLSPTELRVCSLIRLNCATKDIARIMNVSSRSAEMYRYRIRRKMALASGDNLQSILAGIG